ncbi:cytochrome b-245 light chain-like isoform X2 [Babylonia areolata]|uniref:cytochrome b-245 light chain-like isoform X2 n=1 Tax=Babylonia areolata TaxID=304850 RepID=UPI003FD58C96
MGKTEWSMWANEQALVSSAVALLGGLLAVAGQFKNWQFGVYAIVISLLVAVLEYPRGKRQKGRTVERTISVACCFHLSTVLSGVCFIITSIIYMVAALKGEEWIPVEREKESSGPNIIPEPKNPPPRRPPSPTNRL